MNRYGYTNQPSRTSGRVVKSRSERAKQRNLRRGAPSDEEDATDPSADQEMRDDRVAEDMDGEDEEPISNSEIDDDRAFEEEDGSEVSDESGLGPGDKQDTQRTWDEHCYICDDGGDVMVCEGPGCRTVAHYQCLDLMKPPSGDWHCEDCLVKLSRKRTTRGAATKGGDEPFGTMKRGTRNRQLS